ncbi:MAG: PD-(D/E)XK nuclease family protein [Fimbriiglobus sp.]
MLPKHVLAVKPVKTDPVWRGPTAPGPNGGVTFSMLNRFLNCRTRFRVRYIDGLKPQDRFSHQIEYGHMWHVCEEELAKGGDGEDSWKAVLHGYSRGLLTKYPYDRDKIVHWYNVCKVQFPLYVAHYRDLPDVKSRTPVMQEQVFDVPYRLPSGRTVRLRGKIDSADGYPDGLVVKEDKTKGDIDEASLTRQMTMDLQTMIYVVVSEKLIAKAVACSAAQKPMGTLDGDKFLPSLQEWCRKFKRPPVVKGVCYNVVRRPLSGGEGDIRRREPTKGAKCPKCKGAGTGSVDVKSGDRTGRCPKCGGEGRTGAKPGETADEFYARLRGVIDGTGLKATGEPYTGPAHYFMRLDVSLSPADVLRFRVVCLDPILEALCNWYDYVTGGLRKPEYGAYGHHWVHPFGCVNYLDEGGHTDLDEYVLTGDRAGLVRSDELFTELR